MIYSRCKCGNREYWDSGFPPQPCQGCDECHTTLASGPNGHKDPIPHDWKAEWIIRDGEPVKIERCARCYEVKDLGRRK